MATVSDKPWSQFSQSDYADAGDYCSAALVDLNESGQTKTKGNCYLPVREPNGGPLNRNGVHAAAAVLAGSRGGVGISSEAKRAAARKLIGLYGQLNEDPPESIRRLARG